MNKDVILLVDDNESIIFNLSLILAFNDYEVITATNGIEALNILSNSIKKPDLIISDILMPELDGYQLLETISNNPKLNTIPFIFLSAKASPEEIREGKLLGVDDYLTKPIDEQLLLNVIYSKIKKVHQIEVALRNEIDLTFLKEFTDQFNISDYSKANNFVILFTIKLNDKFGPELTKKIINSQSFDFDIDTLCLKLYYITISFLNNNESITPESILLNLDEMHMKALVMYDKRNDPESFKNSNHIMIGIIAPTITYIDSLRLKDTLLAISSDIKNDQFRFFDRYIGEIESLLFHS